MASDALDSGNPDFGDEASTWRRGLASALAFVATLALMGLVLAVAYLGSARDQSLRWERHTENVILLTRSADASMARAEAALGRFVIGGRQNSGSSYFFEWRAAGRQLDELARLVDNDPAQLERVTRLRALYRQRGGQLDDAATRASYKQGWSALSQFDQAGTGPTGDQIEQLLRQIGAAEQDLMRRRMAQTGLLARRTSLFTELLSVLGLIVGAGAIFMGLTAYEAVRQNKAALRLAQAQADRAETLESAVAERTTELRHANEALRVEGDERLAAEAQLRQAQKMEAVGQLTGGIAHDFNNMLAVVVGGLDLAKRKLAGPPAEVERHLNNALEGATRAAQLTRRLLAFARSEPIHPDAVEPARLILGMRDLLDRTLGERVTIATELEDDAGVVWVDPSQLENALLNLAVNARDAMHGEGTLTLSATSVTLGLLEVGHLPGGEYVRISVRDTGGGMPPEVLERAFEPFFTTKPVGKGTGLGLSQLFGFARQSDGDVLIRSQVGVGTEVALYLPRRAAGTQSAEVTPIRAAAAPASTSGANVLLVEDDPRVRVSTQGALEELGHSVRAVDGGSEALDAIAAFDGFDLVVTDVVMPEMTGPELARRLRDAAPHVPVLFVTGYVGEAGDGEELPPEAILRKPFTVSALEAAVDAALQRASEPPPIGRVAAAG